MFTFFGLQVLLIKFTREFDLCWNLGSYHNQWYIERTEDYKLLEHDSLLAFFFSSVVKL